MTGFASVKGIVGKHEIHLEIKSVNGKHCDVKFYSRSRYSHLEIPVVGLIKSHLSRGTIKINLNVETSDKTSHHVSVNRPLLQEWLVTSRKLAEELNVPCDVGLKELLRLPNVFSIAEEEIALTFEQIKPLLEKLLKAFKKSRNEEGKRLVSDMKDRLKTLSEAIKKIKKQDKSRVPNYAERLRSRLQEMAAETELDTERIERELVHYCDRIDITEEVIRIDSHIKMFLNILKEKNAIGKSLDFRCQELLREFNTICNKANCVDISDQAILCRSELEKIREQVQNIE
jgi:uncharacterized protein (TIGR00255 family)